MTPRLTRSRARSGRWLARSLASSCVLVLLVLTGCESRRELTEWQPSDHQPPPSVAPEGQGTGAQSDGIEQASTSRAAAALFEMRCASCHGVQGRGDGPGKPPGASMPDMTRPAYRNARGDAELHAIIKNGRGLMPAFADTLTDVGIDALITHVRTLSLSQ